MDDVTMTTTTYVQEERLLDSLEYVSLWTRMKFNLKKSKNIAISGGKLTNTKL